MNAKLGAVVMAGLVALGCSNSTEPVQTQDLTFLEWAAMAPLLATYQLQFYAFAGVPQQEHFIDYANGEGFLRFRLDSATLVQDAAGDPLAFGDSLLITITVDSTRFIVKFQPEGLLFNPDRPADLELEYDHADSVFLNQEMSIKPWRQERAGDPWQELTPTIWDQDLDEIEVDVFGFTRYALAVN